MSLFSSLSRRAPYLDDPALNPADIGLGDLKRAAWAFAIGERRPSTDPPRGRRIGRGDLPDVDFSRAQVVVRPSRLQRLIAWLAPRKRHVAADEWRVLRPLSETAPGANTPIRRENNIVRINRAA